MATAKITQINGEVCKQLRYSLDEMFRAFREQGIELTIGNMRYNAGEVRFKVTGRVIGATGTPTDASIPSSILSLYGLTSNTVQGRRLVDYNARAKQYPFIYVQGGKRYKTTLARAKVMFAA